MNTCHVCCQALSEGEIIYHAKCSSGLFGTRSIPVLDYSWDDLNKLAEHIIRRSVAVPGVQPKLSLHLERSNSSGTRKFTLVGLEGEFILKPPASAYPDMPELEHFTMQLAEAAGLDVVRCGLIHLASGELAYITRRMDRTENGPLHLEDMCQLTDKMTEQKYRGSMEQVGKAVLAHATNTGFDALRLFEVTLFCFMTGNADMHLKNFSLLYEADGTIRLSPAYDLLPTKLLTPKDPEELALPMNGKKSNLRYKDFAAFGQALKLTDRQVSNAHNRMQNELTKALQNVPMAFLNAARQEQLHDLIKSRAARIWG